MDVAFLIPWRPDGGLRDEIWARLKARHLALGRTVVEGTCPDGPWVKATAVADALSRTDAEVVVVHDADVWTDGIDAALVALGEHPWAVPHLMVHRLAEGHVEPSVEHLEQRPYIGYAGGGVTVLRRDVYEDCPLDPRFEGWGQEDRSWAHALTTLHGDLWRGAADLWHWWHPPEPRQSRHNGAKASVDLQHRYRRAFRRPDVMRQLIREAQRGTSPHRPEQVGDRRDPAVR